MNRRNQQQRERRLYLWPAAAVILLSSGGWANGQGLPSFDFAKSQDAQAWQPVHDVARVQATAEGLLVEISGEDPYLHGPPRDYPAGQPLWLHIRLKPEHAGLGQVFYFASSSAANEQDSVRFPVRGGQWEDVRLPLPPLGPAYCLRFDPPGVTGNRVVVASLSLEPRNVLKEPAWPAPTHPAPSDDALVVQSGDLSLTHGPGQLGGFILRVAGDPMAAGLTRWLIGHMRANSVRWLDLAELARVRVEREQEALVVTATARDDDDTEWSVRQRFAPGPKPGAIDVTVAVSVNRTREVVFLPMLVILPGLGSFGEAKNQAIFAGLEYLDRDEPSSSEADIIGPGAQRQVPDTLKITLPLMAVQAGDRYIGLLWEKEPEFAAVFDSPDRLFKSGAHVMGVLFPGADGTNRAEGSLLPYGGQTLKADQVLTLSATLIGGRGPSVAPALAQYVALRGLPATPKAGVDWESYVATAAAGWLDSRIHVGSQYRHAYPGGFRPQPAADAAVLMDWLARQAGDADLQRRLAEAAKAALAEVKPGDLNSAGISHVRYPVAALVYGHAAENAARADQVARELLAQCEPDGTVRYQKSPAGPDYGRTHFAPDANGLTAAVVARLLEAATVSGDPSLIRDGLRVLRALGKFANSVPRGAQTWEVPLHTPDILASANLVRAYTLGYELTGDAHFLEQARYWAWTGMPFTYLVPPTTEPVGLYATIPVFGATQWVAPNWMGLPVQWCGLVYADALYRLARHDPTGPWKQLADGITASGVQQTWPRASNAERQGLLPDSFAPRAQIRNDPAINPGTLQADAIQLFNRPAVYDFHAFRTAGLLVHAPGVIRNAAEDAGRITFMVDAWPDHAYQSLIVGFRTTPRVRVNGQDVPLSQPHQFDAAAGRLVLTLTGQPVVEIAP